MRTKKNLLLVVTAAMLLSACGGNGGKGNKDSRTPVEKILDSIEHDGAIAFDFDFNIKQYYHEDPSEFDPEGYGYEETFSYINKIYSSSVLTAKYETYHYEGSEDETTVYRYVKDRQGYLSTSMLDYTNNEVRDIPLVYTSTNQKALYSDVYGNPFAGSADSWEDDGEGTLTYKGEGKFNEDIFTSLTSFYYNSDTLDLKITYDVETLTATGFACHDLEEMVSEPDPMWDMPGSTSGQELTITATFTDPAEFDVPDAPTRVEEQSGQSELDALFTSLREGNYTIDYEYQARDDRYQLSTMTSKVEFTPTSYVIYDSTNWQYSNPTFGAYTTADGNLQKFYVDAFDNEVYNSAKPIKGKGSAYDLFFEYLFSYTGFVFNVNSDGTYSLPSIKGLYESDLSGGAFGPDELVMSRKSIVEGSLKIKLTDDGFEYEYQATDSSTVKATVSKIGTTEFSYDVSAAHTYEPETSLTNWLMNTMCYEEYSFVMSLCSGGSSNEIPFVEPAANYQTTMRKRAKVDEETEESTWYNYSFEIYTECSDKAELKEYMDEFKSLVDANENFRYDEKLNGYIYSKDGEDLWEVYGWDFSAVSDDPFVDLWGREYEETFFFWIENLQVPEEIRNMWDD